MQKAAFSEHWIRTYNCMNANYCIALLFDFVQVFKRAWPKECDIFVDSEMYSDFIQNLCMVAWQLIGFGG